MRHQKAGVKLNRTSSHRNAMFRNMVTSLFEHGQIKTTDVKAKELRRWADQMITLAKRGDLHARRQVLAIMKNKKLVHELFATVEEKFGDRKSGYSRITKIGIRRGDAASLSLVELLIAESAKKKKKAGILKKTKDAVVKEKAPQEDKVEAADKEPEVEASEPEPVEEPQEEAKAEEAGEKTEVPEAEGEEEKKPE